MDEAPEATGRPTRKCCTTGRNVREGPGVSDGVRVADARVPVIVVAAVVTVADRVGGPVGTGVSASVGVLLGARVMVGKSVAVSVGVWVAK